MACIGVSPSYPARARCVTPSSLPSSSTSPTADRHGRIPGPQLCRQPQQSLLLLQIGAARPAAADRPCRGRQVALDGNNTSDLGDYRPGMAAARERSVRSPLIEALIGKPEVRALAQALGLPVWDKPAMACLSSWVLHGTPITPELLRQIEGAEDAVELGFRQFRGRHHGEIARLELPVEEFPLAMEQHGAIVAGVTAAGYPSGSTLDLAGSAVVRSTVLTGQAAWL